MREYRLEGGVFDGVREYRLDWGRVHLIDICIDICLVTWENLSFQRFCIVTEVLKFYSAD